MLQVLAPIVSVCIQGYFWLMLLSRRRIHALHEFWLCTDLLSLELPEKYFFVTKVSLKDMSQVCL